VIVGYAKRERSYAGFAVGIVLFFLVGLFIGLNCAENPVCDILDAHADGMAYGFMPRKTVRTGCLPLPP